MGMITRKMTSMIKGLGLSAFLSINIWGLGCMVLPSLVDSYGHILVLWMLGCLVAWMHGCLVASLLDSYLGCMDAWWLAGWIAILDSGLLGG
jgi:hypothetical protein